MLGLICRRRVSPVPSHRRSWRVTLLLAVAVAAGPGCAPARPAAAPALVGRAPAAVAPTPPIRCPLPPPPQPAAVVDAALDRELDDVAAAARAPGARRATAAALPISYSDGFSATAYCLKGRMRTGVRTRNGMAAADPRVLPLGSVVRVSHPDGRVIGIFVIMDTGGAIRGRKLDLYMDSCREAIQWGRRPVVAQVVSIGRR